ncbi:MAG: AMP-binding protein [Planctomycetes bacterium]|nr:AMP-binding protein [Planctomycetota bacterium]
MALVSNATICAPDLRLNVADRLAEVAAHMPDAIAVACPQRASPGYAGKRRGDSGADYATTTFAELDADATRVARGLAAWGVPQGTRLALLVRPGIEFVTLVFALLRAGMVIVLVDPGLGRRNLIRCLQEAQPEGFVAISMAQAMRVLLRHKFPRARWNVTVGRRWFWGRLTLDELRMLDAGYLASSIQHPASSINDPAAIIFTSGSTGPPKGVLYTHRMFDAQVAEIQSAYGIEPGGVDLACFPLFALFNSAMGVTTVFPEMDFSRPASADPRKLLAAANDWQVTQAFASPAVWRMISEHCAKEGERIPSLRQVLSCGAPVSASLLRKTLACVADDAKMHTPYGATECLPVATIEAAEVLNETAAQTDEGAGVCVGRKFDSIEWRVIRITDEPIATIDETEELPPGEIGELIVRGPQASPLYITRTECNADAKIADERAGSSPTPAGGEDAPARVESECGARPWHRMGDVGYLDQQGRFWYCGRKSQRVETKDGPLFTECIEAVFNRHPAVQKSALVGLGDVGKQAAVICILLSSDTKREWGRNPTAEKAQLAENHHVTKRIHALVYFPVFPVDIRHNSKIVRELLRDCASGMIRREPMQYSDFVYSSAESPANNWKNRSPFASTRKK